MPHTNLHQYPNIQRLFSVPYWDGKTSFGLDSPRALLRALGDPQDQIPTVHVAGTNGKGSVCSYLCSIMKEAGKKTAQFSSPHLVDVTERFLIEGEQVSHQILDDALAKVFSCADKLQLAPSYFELVTAAGFLIFKEQDVEFAAIEVGLGGRLDATNCIKKPLVSVITSISLDHTHLLGDTEEKIAREKGGIVKHGVPLVLGQMSEVARDEIKAIAANLDVKVHSYGEEFSLSADLKELAIKFCTERHTAFGLENLPGYQPFNGAVAAQAALLLGVSKKAIASGIATARWPGRLERIVVESSGGNSVDVLIDAAHNPQGLNSLISYLKQLVSKEDLTAVTFLVSFLSTKDYQQMIEILRSVSSQIGVETHFVFTASEHSSAVSSAELKSAMGQGRSEPDSKEALAQIIETAKSKSLIVLTGSIYLIGSLRKSLLAKIA